MKYQLCPKCNGDGHLGRFNSPNTSSNACPQCDVCFGAKTLLVRDDQPIVTDEQILRVLQNHQRPGSEGMFIVAEDFSSIIPRMRKLFQEQDNTKAELEKFFNWYKKSP